MTLIQQRLTTFNVTSKILDRDILTTLRKVFPDISGITIYSSGFIRFTINGSQYESVLRHSAPESKDCSTTDIGNLSDEDLLTLMKTKRETVATAQLIHDYLHAYVFVKKC